MSKVVFDISMSLDGYITGPNSTDENPLGDGGERLHDWAMGDDERGRQVLEEAVAVTGAIVVGRRTYDHSIRWWQADGPTGAARVPTYVITHRPPEDPPENGVYTFATDGIEKALDDARATADGRTVAVGGGAETARQVIYGGLVDEVSLHVVPVLFGGGMPLFGDRDLELEPIEAIHTPTVTHLRYRLKR
jgi:dihydrofolate reductase